MGGNFYDYVSSRFPIMTPAEAGESLRNKRNAEEAEAYKASTNLKLVRIHF